jgi:membrane-associated protease RseP (regulator of RpoE activity)
MRRNSRLQMPFHENVKVQIDCAEHVHFDLGIQLRYIFEGGIMKKFVMLVFILIILFLPYSLSFAANGGGKFGGVGIDGTPLPNGQIEVRQLVSGGPAYRAGIRVGDVITHVDGIPTKGSNFNSLVGSRLRGREGTNVRLTVQRPGQTRPLQYTVTRRQMIAPQR